MRTRLAGDHSSLHCGCAAVWSMMNVLARRKGWTVVREGEDYDALILNGEGTMHHASGNFHRQMQLLRDTLDAGKDAYLINTVWQENPNDYDDVLKRLSGISVREIYSYNDMLARHGIRPRLNIDLSFFAPLSWSWPWQYRPYQGATVATDLDRFGE